MIARCLLSSGGPCSEVEVGESAKGPSSNEEQEGKHHRVSTLHQLDMQPLVG